MYSFFDNDAISVMSHGLAPFWCNRSAKGEIYTWGEAGATALGYTAQQVQHLSWTHVTSQGFQSYVWCVCGCRLFVVQSTLTNCSTPGVTYFCVPAATGLRPGRSSCAGLGGRMVGAPGATVPRDEDYGWGLALMGPNIIELCGAVVSRKWWGSINYVARWWVERRGGGGEGLL